MSNKFKYINGYELLRALPVASGAVIDIGEHLQLSAGLVTPVVTSTDNLVFIGVAKEAHRATDPAGDLTVALRNAQAIYEVELDAATDITAGDALQLNGNQALKKSATDPVAIAVETKLAATKVRVIYKIPATFIGDAS